MLREELWFSMTRGPIVKAISMHIYSHPVACPSALLSKHGKVTLYSCDNTYILLQHQAA